MQLLRDYALSFVGVPYKWGGAHPADGLDCSGFAQLLLRAAGIDPPGDQTAQAIYDAIVGDGRVLPGPVLGTFLFFGESVRKITHVAFALDPYRMIEAAGGGPTTKTLKDAIAHEAFIKISLIKDRKNLAAVVKPNYVKIGYFP